MGKLKAANPWWLDEGTEICPVCYQLYLYEVEYRCPDCDGPACPNCVSTTESRTQLCMPCFKTTKEIEVT